MLFRSHLHNGRSIIGKAVSKNGYDFKVEKFPFIEPATDGIFADFEEYGVEDLRINPLGIVLFILPIVAYSQFWCTHYIGTN